MPSYDAILECTRKFFIGKHRYKVPCALQDGVIARKKILYVFLSPKHIGVSLLVWYLFCDKKGELNKSHIMHQSFVSTTPRRAGNPGEFDNKFFPERRAFDNKLQPHTGAIDKLGLIPRHRFEAASSAGPRCVMGRSRSGEGLRNLVKKMAPASRQQVNFYIILNINRYKKAA